MLAYIPLRSVKCGTDLGGTVFIILVRLIAVIHRDATGSNATEYRDTYE
jgi:hypothetical protein